MYLYTIKTQYQIAIGGFRPTAKNYFAYVTVWGKYGPVYDTDFCWQIGLKQMLNKQLTWTIMPVYPARTHGNL